MFILAITILLLACLLLDRTDPEWPSFDAAPGRRRPALPAA